MAKNFLKSDALGFFKKAILAGGDTSIDERVLQKHFDNFLESNSAKFTVGKKGAIDVTGAPGVKKKVKATDYDWNKVISSIADDFGYEINFNNIRSLDDFTLEGDTYRKNYLDFYSQMEAKTGMANSPGGFRYKNGEMAPRSENRKNQLTKEQWKEQQHLSRVKPGDEMYEQGIVRDIDNTPKANSALETRTLKDAIFELDDMDKDIVEQAKEYRKMQEGETVKQAYTGFGPFKKKVGEINADARAGVGHTRARMLEDNPTLRKAVGLLNEIDILKAGRNGISNSAHDTGMAKKVLNDATGKDGVGLWGKAWGFAKNHPVITTGAAVGTVWGISEFAEDDDF